MANVGELDVSKYPTLKAKGLVTLAKVGKMVVVSLTTFDPQTGEEKDPSMAPVYSGAFNEMDKQVALQQANLDAMKAGIEALKADVAALG